MRCLWVLGIVQVEIDDGVVVVRGEGLVLMCWRSTFLLFWEVE